MVRQSQDADSAELVHPDGDGGVAALVDEHYGAMHRLARLVGRDPALAREAVRAACLKAVRPGEDPVPGTSLRGRLLRLVLVELAAPRPPVDAAPAAPADELESEDGRWAGWWKDDLPPTPRPEHEALERALASIPAGLTAILVLRDVEQLGADEVEALLDHSSERQLALLHHGRSALRNELRAATGPRP